MDQIITFLMLLVASSTMAQFSGGRHIVKDEITGQWYVFNNNGVIYVEDGNGGFTSSGVGVGLTSVGMMIANSKMYIAQANKIKVVDLQPTVQLDTTWTFSIPIGVYMNGICWDGNNTLYSHDQTKIYQVDMTTGVSSTIHSGIPQSTSAQGMEYDPLGDRLVMILNNSSAIMGYDLQNNTYDTLVDPDMFWGKDITRTCDGQWLLIGGGSSTGFLYNLPGDFSSVGDTLAMLLGQPNYVYYDAQNDEAVWINTQDSIFYHQHPCQPFTSVQEQVALPAPPSLNYAHGELTLWWDQPTSATHIEIRSMTGQLLQRSSFPTGRLRDGMRLQLPELSSGLYLVNVIAGPDRASATFAVE